MRVVDLIPAPYRLLAVGVLLTALVGGSAASAWKVQDWRYGQQLAEQANLHKDDLIAISNAAADQVRTAQDKRLALELRLSASEQTHYKELSDAQTNQARLRDRLATADLRLSVLLDAADAVSGDTVSAATPTGGMVHDPTRAQLDPAHAQRIIGITDAGDQGLIALAALSGLRQRNIDAEVKKSGRVVNIQPGRRPCRLSLQVQPRLVLRAQRGVHLRRI